MLDPTLTRWADRHGLRIYTSHKDEDVRSIDIVSPKAERFQIWLDPPERSGRTTVHAWDYRRRRASFNATVYDLEAQLERAYSQVTSWF
jgi:hypothetical protein